MAPDPSITPRNRLWTPWRMSYVGGGAREPGCILCNRLDGDDDLNSLVVYRGRHSFVMLNLYPYNTGHLMVVPNAHVQDPAELNPETQSDMATLTGNLTRILRRVFNCDGFNVGMNIGSAAGAGIADHLHQHIVPRWVGDANFMPILASTKVLPELLTATYGKVRAEIERDIRSASEAKVLAFVGDSAGVAMTSSGLPIVELEPELPVWRSVLNALATNFEELEILGWAGRAGTRESDDSVPKLAVRAEAVREGVNDFSVLNSIDIEGLSDDDQEIIRRGLARFGL